MLQKVRQKPQMIIISMIIIRTVIQKEHFFILIYSFYDMYNCTEIELN